MFVLDTLEGETERQGFIVLAVVAHTGTILVGIGHGRKGWDDRLEDVGMGGGIVGLVQMTVEFELHAEAVDLLTLQTVNVGPFVGALQQFFEETAVRRHLHVGTNIGTADEQGSATTGKQLEMLAEHRGEGLILAERPTVIRLYSVG